MSAAAIETAFPLTPLQEGMLYHTLREPDAGVYHAQCTAHLEGNLREGAFRQAWQLAAQRHPALRTFFSWERRERPLQAVRSAVDVPVLFLDWRDASPVEQAARWQKTLTEDRRTGGGLALTSAPVMRVVVARMDERRYRLLWAIHHAVADGWSGHLVLREVLRDHALLATGRQPEATAAPSFDRFVGWLQQQDARAADAFWRQALAGVTDPTPLPGGRRAHRTGSDRQDASVVLSAAETARLAAAAARMRVTVNTLLMGVWTVLLARHAGREDVIFGVTVSERPAEIPEVQNAVGPYLATVPLRHRVRGDEAIPDWLRAVQRALSEARSHAAPGLPAIQRWSGVPPAMPLITSLVVCESFPAPPAGDLIPVAAAPLVMREALFEVPNDVPLVVMAMPGERLTLKVIHDPAVVPVAMARRLADGLRAGLAVLARADEQPTAALFALPPAERNLVLDRWSTAAQAAPLPRDVVERFESRVAAFGAAIAVQDGDATVSYDALDRRANRVGNHLLSSGVRPGALVGLLVERSPEFLAAMFGVLKMGAAYVPLDPGAPDSRLASIASGLDALLCPRALRGRLTTQVPVLTLDDAASASAERPGGTVDATAPAYVMYTSGSTGQPKGVVVERGALAASTAARDVYYGEPPSRFLLLSPTAVDSSVAGIYWTLCTGGTLVLPSRRGEQDAGALADLIARARVTHTLMVPSLYRELLAEADARRLETLRCVVVAGEAASAALVRQHSALLPNAALHNEYGPSEATVWATADESSAHPDGPVTLGRPVPGARVYLLDAALRPVPAGAPGEICIGGAFVARGYLQLPDETARRFRPDPFVEGGRLYRTGDRARFLDDGRLEFLGRVDDQLKVRGFRVEPEEIERVLRGVGGVRDAAVVLAATPTADEVDELTAALVRRSDAEIDRFLADAEAGA